MNIQSTKPRLPAQKPASNQNEKSNQSQEPKEPWHKQAGDYLDLSNDILTPKITALGMAASFAMKGHQISESLHPVSKAAFIIGGGVVGAALGYGGGKLIHGLTSKVSDTVFGDKTSLIKSALTIGANAAAISLVGGATGAALYGAFTVAGAGELARQDIMKR